MPCLRTHSPLLARARVDIILQPDDLILKFPPGSACWNNAPSVSVVEYDMLLCFLFHLLRSNSGNLCLIHFAIWPADVVHASHVSARIAMLMGAWCVGLFTCFDSTNHSAQHFVQYPNCSRYIHRFLTVSCVGGCRLSLFDLNAKLTKYKHYCPHVGF